MSTDTMIQEKPCYSYGFEPSTANKTGDWRFLTPEKSSRLSPCRQDCLLDGEIPLWMEAVKQEKWEEAWQIVSRYNPFPAITGYVCYHPCTSNCNRGQLDQDIAIEEVEKAIGEWRLNNIKAVQRPIKYKGKIGIVGSGPAGLSCAYYLNAAGYSVTVYEKTSLIGGMLTLGIPEYRLPRYVLNRELYMLEESGIHFIKDCPIGDKKDLCELYEEYDNIFLATGAWKPRRAYIPGEEDRRVYNALDFLSAINSGGQLEISDPVVVIGGGNAAIDSARSALRLKGVNHVSLVYRRSRAEMPANQEEVEAAEREGVELIFNALPREVEKEEQDIIGLMFDYCKTDLNGLSIDRSRSFSKSCGTVVMALGQQADLSVFCEFGRDVPFFAGGDLITGPSTVPEAIKAGRIAAYGIVADLEGLPVPQVMLPEQPVVSFEDLNLATKLNIKMQHKECTPELEASRCLGCGTCNACGTCYIFCPDMAIDVINGRFELNLDYCKGCGICVKECPAQALVLEGGR